MSSTSVGTWGDLSGSTGFGVGSSGDLSGSTGFGVGSVGDFSVTGSRILFSLSPIIVGVVSLNVLGEDLVAGGVSWGADLRGCGHYYNLMNKRGMSMHIAT